MNKKEDSLFKAVRFVIHRSNRCGRITTFTNDMDKRIKEMFPSWVNEINENNKLILTNDLDSLFTVAILRKLFGCQVGMFYDFEHLYSTQKRFNKQDVIGCDLAIEDNEIKTFCNHVTKMSKDDEVNPLSANLNNIAGIYGGKYNSNYTNKYGGSTALTVLSLYEAFDLLLLDGHTELTEMQKLILISIDSYFYGKDFADGEYFYKWQRCLGLEMFNDVLDKYSKAELVRYQNEHKLKEDIYMNGNTLSTDLDIQFIQKHFPMLDFSLDEEYISEHTFQYPTLSMYFTGDSKHDLKGNVFSFSVYDTWRVTYTLFKEEQQ